MKHYIWTLCLTFTLSLATITCNTGCKTANRTAYIATGVAVTTVDAAMSAWGDYVAANHPSITTEQKVKDAFLKYQAAANAVADAGIAVAHAKAANADSTVPASALNVAIAVASSTLADLVNLVRQFGAKI